MYFMCQPVLEFKYLDSNMSHNWRDQYFLFGTSIQNVVLDETGILVIYCAKGIWNIVLNMHVTTVLILTVSI